MRSQLARYQRLLPRPGQAHVAAPPVAAVGSMMAPQQGLPPQQPGMRHPMHGENIDILKIVSKLHDQTHRFSSHSLELFL